VNNRHGRRGLIPRRPALSRQVVATAAGIAVVAAGGAIALHALTGPASLSLSSSTSREHRMMTMTGTTGLADMTGISGLSRMDRADRMRHWSFTTIGNPADPTFNQLLGISNQDQIAGYFGSGAQGHPNVGYLLAGSAAAPRFTRENVPGAVQTQVTGLNDRGVTVGFWSGQNTASQMNDNFGFYAMGGQFHTVNFPTMNNARPAADQLLGVNDEDVAVGFYTNGQGVSRGFEYSLRSHRFRRVLLPGLRNLSAHVSETATAINNRGDVAGFYSVGSGKTRSFLKTAGGRVFRLAYPGASATQAFGVNDWREVVGTYQTGSGMNAKSFGFIWTRQGGVRTVDDPLGRGATTINGVNDLGELVGFYTDAAGNTDGLLWAPSGATAPGMPMPSASASMPMTAAPSATPTTAVPMPSSPAPATSAPMPGSSASPSGGPW
jgi:hypothetical protein